MTHLMNNNSINLLMYIKIIEMLKCTRYVKEYDRILKKKERDLEIITGGCSLVDILCNSKN